MFVLALRLLGRTRGLGLRLRTIRGLGGRRHRLAAHGQQIHKDLGIGDPTETVLGRADHAGELAEHRLAFEDDGATVAREGLGGPRADGKALAAGDSLGWLADGARPRALPLPSERIMDCTGEARLELILGAQIGDFPAMSLFDAFNGDWQVDTRADRMGVRLLGPRLECRQQSMISEGIALGAVQVPPDGQPIVLLNDRQTIGGYPRLGALAPLALARLAQCLPGQPVRLLPTVQEAAHREHRRLLAAWDA